MHRKSGTKIRGNTLTFTTFLSEYGIHTTIGEKGQLVRRNSFHQAVRPFLLVQISVHVRCGSTEGGGKFPDRIYNEKTTEKILSCSPRPPKNHSSLARFTELLGYFMLFVSLHDTKYTHHVGDLQCARSSNG